METKNNEYQMKNEIALDTLYAIIDKVADIPDSNTRISIIAHEICKVDDLYILHCMATLALNNLINEILYSVKDGATQCLERETNVIEFPPTK